MGFLSDQESDMLLSGEESLSFLEPAVTKTKPKKRDHKCHFIGCTKVFSKPSRLTWHIRQHTGEKPYKCKHPGCEKAYATSSHLKRHQSTAHEAIRASYMCDICKMVLKSLDILKKHHKAIHNSKLTCSECNLTFRKKYKFEEHKAIHQGIKIKCEKCPREFATTYLLNKHVTGSHKIHACPEEGCSLTFEKYTDLRTHRVTHNKGFECDTCKKVFQTKTNLRRHQNTHKDNFLKCPFEGCSNTYNQEQNLTFHIKSKHYGQKFYCDHCQNDFISKKNLKRHIQLVHVNPKPPKKPKSGPERVRRKDAGIEKKSMVSKLSGLMLPQSFEKAVANRDSDQPV